MKNELHETPSSLAWLDFDEETRRTMQEHLAALAEPNTVDELGIGQVRDVFSGIFFPGTSTLWRRARYMLFVPWVYRDLELHGTKKSSGLDASRRLQKRLIRALKQGDDHEGLIGRYKDEPVRMPDELVWNGLRSWGIRRREGSLGKYRRMLESGDAGRFELVRGADDAAIDAEGGSWWHAALPPMPSDLLEGADFGLSWDEADFLRSRLDAEHHGTFLSSLLDDPDSADPDAEWPWHAHETISRLDVETQAAVDHARVFSETMQGAGILYSYHVAVRRELAELAQKLSNDLSDWASRLPVGDVAGWPKRRESFWLLINEENPGLRSGTIGFVDDWMGLVRLSPAELLESRDARELIRGREWDVKRHLARLSNPAALDHARAEAGTGQLDYRWYQASSITRDICAGLRDDEE